MDTRANVTERLLGGTNLKRTLGVLAVLLILLLLGNYGLQAEISVKPTGEIGNFYPSEWGIEHPAGLAYSAKLDLFFALDQVPSEQPAEKTTLLVFTPYEDLVATVDLPIAVTNAINFTFDDTENRLLFLNPALTELIQVKVSSDGAIDPATATHVAIGQIGLKSAQGMAVDVEGKFLWILDSAASQVVRVALQADLNQAQFSKLDLAPELDGPNLRGLALHPINHHLSVVHPRQHVLYELGTSAEVAAKYDLSGLKLIDPRAMTYAASPDLTDDPQIVHLFMADSLLPASPENNPSFIHKLFMSFLTTAQDGNATENEATRATTDEEHAVFGRIIEVTLDPAEVVANVAAPNEVMLTLVRTINTAAWSPPSPDPSGITYLPDTDILLVVDGEVEEMPPYFAGVNIFGSTRAGQLSYTKSSLDYSIEPVGVAYNPANKHLFISDDNRKKVFEINPGPDGQLDTNDDIVTSFSTQAFNSRDPEGVDYDPGSGHLFISDGTNNEIYRVNPGPNGRFDGVPGSGGDDIVTNFDTAIYGIRDPSGVAFNTATGTMLVVAGNNDRIHMHELSTTGALVQIYNISAANGMRLDGVAIAPGSTNPQVMNFYIADRRVDNDRDPNENDGKIYEMTSGSNPPTPTSTRTPTPTRTNTPGPGPTPTFTNTPTPTRTNTPGPGPTPTNTPTPTPTNTPTQGGNGDKIFVSSTSGGNIGGVSFADEDVLVYDTNARTWALYFDGSDVGLNTFEVDNFTLLGDGSMLLGFAGPGNVGSLGLVDDSDIVRFIPTSIGPTTAGTFEWYFDGSDVELTEDGEDIDALHRLNDGRLVLSATGVSNVTGASTLDEDMLVFTPSQLGATTSGTWAVYFDGSDVGLNGVSTEDVNGVWIDPANGEIYLTTNGAFAVTGVSGDGADIFICAPGSIGPNTSCTYRSYWDGSANGFAGEVIDALFIDKGGQQLSSATMAGLRAVEHMGEGDDPLADPDEGVDEESESGDEYQMFLPLTSP
ncbi:MAG: hypothetical protein IT328_06885 [Caldilineaceae bacterium]|nr:hypothetical protein [Caldilineaceae bacterium]